MAGFGVAPNCGRDDLASRLQSAEAVIAQQRKLLQAKEAMLQNYMQQYRQLSTDYERILDARPAPAWPDAGRFLPSSLSGFDLNLDFPPALDPPRRRPQETFTADSAVPQPPAADAVLSRRGLQSQISFGPDESSPVKRFNPPFHGQCAPVPQRYPDTIGLTIDQMRARVDELTLERAELERQLNKALPKGKVMSHLIREREEIEAQFNEVSKTIARIRLEIRRAAAS
jgi:hypothetical protein